MSKLLPIYKIRRNGLDGITKMSLVDSPAVLSDFMAFNEQEPLKFSYDEDKHIVFGCALRCNFPIYRCDKKGEYYVVFDKESIEDLYENFMIENKGGCVNLKHSDDVEGVHIIQSLIKDTEKGISPVGFENVENGSWFVAYKVDNEEVWQSIKNEEYKGFSVECFVELDFDDKESEDDIEKLVNDIINYK